MEQSNRRRRRRRSMTKQKSTKGRAKAQGKGKETGTPLRSKKPGLMKFGTKENLAAHLKEEYQGQGKSTVQIAKDLGVTPARIGELMVEYGIPTRGQAKKEAAEEKKGGKIDDGKQA